jgi:hypothetical protein
MSWPLGSVVVVTQGDADMQSPSVIKIHGGDRREGNPVRKPTHADFVVMNGVPGWWATRHHFAFFGKPGEHGELIVLYLGVILALLLAGPGRYSVDWC